MTPEMLNAILVWLRSNQIDLDFHRLNLNRYEAIFEDEDLENESDFAKKIEKEIPILRTRIKEVELVIKHTRLQLNNAWYDDTQIDEMINNLPAEQTT